jgi:hypothetical protein
MQHGGQKSEAGGCECGCHGREVKAWRLERQIIRTDGADRSTPRQALCEIRSAISVTAPNLKDACTILAPAVTGDVFGHAWRYPRPGKRAAWYGYAEKSRAHALSVDPVRSRFYCALKSRVVDWWVTPLNTGLQDIQRRRSVLYGDSLVAQDAAVKRSSGTNRLLPCLHAFS